MPDNTGSTSRYVKTSAFLDLNQMGEDSLYPEQ